MLLKKVGKSNINPILRVNNNSAKAMVDNNNNERQIFLEPKCIRRG